MKNWALIAVKANRENKTAAALARRGIKFYMPVLKSLPGQSMDKTPFQGLLFVNVSNVVPSEMLLLEKYTRCVYWKNEPVMVSDGTVEKIRMICDQYPNVVFEKIPVCPGSATIVEEQMLFKKTTGLNLLTCKQISVIVPCLGYKLRAVKDSPLQPVFPQQQNRVNRMMQFLFTFVF